MSCRAFDGGPCRWGATEALVLDPCAQCLTSPGLTVLACPHFYVIIGAYPGRTVLRCEPD
jgi:hypothetical protein